MATIWRNQLDPCGLKGFSTGSWTEPQGKAWYSKSCREHLKISGAGGIFQTCHATLLENQLDAVPKVAIPACIPAAGETVALYSHDTGDADRITKHCWLVVWNIFYFPIYWEFHHPNWLIFFRGVQTTNQIRFSSFVHGWTRDATKAKCWRASETQRQLPPLCWAWGCWGFTQRTWKDLASSDQSTYSPKLPWSSTTWPHWQPFMPIQELGSPVKLAPLNAFYADTRAKKPCRLLTYSPKMQTTSTAWPHPQTFMPIQEQGRPVGCQPTALNCN